MVADIGFHAHSRFRCPVRRIRVQTAVQRDSSRCTAVTLFFPIRRLWHTSLPPPAQMSRRTGVRTVWRQGNCSFQIGYAEIPLFMVLTYRRMLQNILLPQI